MAGDAGLLSITLETPTVGGRQGVGRPTQHSSAGMQNNQRQKRQHNKKQAHVWAKILGVAELQNYLQGDAHRIDLGKGRHCALSILTNLLKRSPTVQSPSNAT